MEIAVHVANGDRRVRGHVEGRNEQLKEKGFSEFAGIPHSGRFVQELFGFEDVDFDVPVLDSFRMEWGGDSGIEV